MRLFSAVAVVGVLVLSGCTSDEASPPKKVEYVDAEVDSVDYLVLTDSGFSVLDGDDGDDGKKVLYSISVKNTSKDYVPFDVALNIDWIDESGQVVDANPDRICRLVWVPPGEVWTFSGQDRVDGVPVDLSIRFPDADGTDRWLIYDRLTDYGELFVGESHVVPVAERKYRGLWESKVAVESTFSYRVGVGIHAVMYDSNGNIVGGGTGFWDNAAELSPGNEIMGFYFPIELIPETADLSKTEYHVQLYTPPAVKPKGWTY